MSYEIDKNNFNQNFVLESQAHYDLEERTFNLAKSCRGFTKKLTRTAENVEDIKQLTRASGSVAANYIEANEAFSRKDFLYRIKVTRKEAKEAKLFLRLVDCHGKEKLENERTSLIDEALQLVKIFNAIAEKTEPPKK